MLCLAVSQLVFLVAPAAHADVPVEAPFEIQGKISNPDGSPAPLARVTVESYWPNSSIEPPVSVQCDENGTFHGLRSRFGFTTSIHAVSADGSAQSQVLVPDFMARTFAAEPLDIQLKPAQRMTVTVTSQQAPLPGCTLIIDRLPGGRAVTDASGEATLFVPPNWSANSFVAFHPRHGIGVWEMKDEASKLPAQVEIQLAKPRPHQFRVTDQRQEPVADFRISPAVNWGSGWAVTNGLPAAHTRTGEGGKAAVLWMPDNYRHINAPAVSTRWQVDEWMSDGDETELHVREKHSFVGLVQFPDGKSRAGVLVVARSFGPSSSGDHAQTRTNDKGVFQLHLAPDHAYILSVRDREWGSDLQAGVFLRTKEDQVEYAKRGTILSAQPTTPVTVMVADADGGPVESAWINVSMPREVEWVDPNGKKRQGTNSVHHWLRTDEGGLTSFGALPGKVHFRATKHGWTHERDAILVEDEPLTVTILREQ